MTNILDIDTLFIVIVLLFISIKDINPYVQFAGAVIVILVGITKLVQFYFWLNDRKKEKK